MNDSVCIVRRRVFVQDGKNLSFLGFSLFQKEYKNGVKTEKEILENQIPSNSIIVDEW